MYTQALFATKRSRGYFTTPSLQLRSRDTCHHRVSLPPSTTSVTADDCYCPLPASSPKADDLDMDRQWRMPATGLRKTDSADRGLRTTSITNSWVIYPRNSGLGVVGAKTTLLPLPSSNSVTASRF